MIALSLNQSRQLEKHILSKKEHAKLFFVQMLVTHCKSTAWYVPMVPNLTRVVYDSKEYDFERYKLTSDSLTKQGPSIVLIPRNTEKKGDRLTVFGEEAVASIYQQIMKNVQKYAKEPWSFYEKTWRIEESRLLRQK